MTPTLVLSLLLLAQAEEPRFLLEVVECPGLEAAEIQRLLTIETAGLPKDQPGQVPLRLTVRCAEGQTRIDIVNPATGRHVERIIPTAETGQAERVIALAASQLLVSSWLELYCPQPAEEEKKPPPPSPPETVVVTRAPDYTVAARAVVTLRDLATPFLLYGARLRLGFAPADDWTLFIDLSFDAGRAVRDAGGVDAMLAGLGAGASWTFLQTGPFAMDLRATLAGKYARLGGDPAAEPVMGTTSGGLVGEAAAALGAGLWVGSFWVGLDIEAGVTFPAAAGLVAGEPEVRLSGFWAAMGLGATAQF